MLILVFSTGGFGQQVGKPQGRNDVNFAHLTLLCKIKLCNGIVIENAVIELVEKGIAVDISENGIAKVLKHRITHGLPPPFITRFIMASLSASALFSGRI